MSNEASVQGFILSGLKKSGVRYWSIPSLKEKLIKDWTANKDPAVKQYISLFLYQLEQHR